MSKIIMIDFSLYLHRAVYSLNRNPENIPTYLALRMIMSCLKKIGVDPDDRIIVALDAHSWRKDYDKTYKADRAEVKEKSGIDWNYHYEQFNKLEQQLDNATDWNFIRVNPLEADDLMAVGARFFKDKEVVLITYDSDMEPLMSYPNVKIFSSLKKCRGHQGKGAYKIKEKTFNPYKLISKKIDKEIADNLKAPIRNEEDYNLRKMLVNLLELPETIENQGIEALTNLPNKELNLELIPFPSIRNDYMNIYNSDKIVTYKASSKKLINRKKRK